MTISQLFCLFYRVFNRVVASRKYVILIRATEAPHKAEDAAGDTSAVPSCGLLFIFDIWSVQMTRQLFRVIVCVRNNSATLWNESVIFKAALSSPLNEILVLAHAFNHTVCARVSVLPLTVDMAARISGNKELIMDIEIFRLLDATI